MSEAWELSKENAAPLAKGRKAASLSAALSGATSAPSAHSAAISKANRKHEATLLTAEDQPDPLVPYLSYINHIEQNCPSDTSALFLLLEKTTRAFISNDRYHADPRYIRACITYADKTQSPMDVFKFLHKKGIGRHSALFWIAWAWVAEKKGDFKTADKVFRRAQDGDVEPRKMLDARYRQFQRRMSRHWLKKAEEQDQETEQPSPPRQTLTTIHTAQTANPTSGLGGFAAQNQSQSNSNTNPDPSFAIFQDSTPANESLFDTSVNDSILSRAELATEADRTKENTQRATAWTDPLAGPSHHPTTAMDSLYSVPAPQEQSLQPASSFEVFVDPGLDAEDDDLKSTYVTSGKSLRQRKETAASDKLLQDPLRYLKNPDKAEKDSKKSSSSANKKESNGKKNSAISTEPAADMKCGFSKRLIAKDSDGVEMCFEEGRAAANYYNFADDRELFVPSVDKNETKAADSDDDDDVEMEDQDASPSPSDGTPVSPRRSLFGPTQRGLESSSARKIHKRSISAPMCANELSFTDGTSFEPGTNPINTSTTSCKSNPSVDEDQTINTKLAMADLGSMFGSPSASLPAADVKTEASTPRPLFSSTSNPPCAKDETANASFAADISQTTSALSSIKLTNADVLKQSMVHHSNSTEDDSQPSFQVYCDETPATGGFEIFKDDAPPETSVDPKTPAFSIFQESGSPIDCVDEPAVSPANFGDITRIDGNDNTIVNFTIHEDDARRHLDYNTTWKQSIRASVDTVLAENPDCDLRHKSVPKISANKANLKIGSHSYCVKKELGRGAYGVVYLVEEDDGSVSALKVQKPIGSLALEYEMLVRAKESVEDPSFLSEARSLSVFSDGACLTMRIEQLEVCARERDAFLGLTLLDVVNAFKKAGEPIPEVVAAWYTVKTLKIFEQLHGNGKILHCDVKPDNFIVVPAEIDGEMIQSAGVKLIDFGRAVTLQPDKAMSGDAAGEDMQCPAMLEERPWLEDVDTFGLCATSHVMLFGDHMEISKDVKGRWRPRKSIRRYWQGELWHAYFDTLLNSGGDGGDIGVGSKVEDLARLRGGFEVFLAKSKPSEMKALLRHQSHLCREIAAAKAGK